MLFDSPHGDPYFLFAALSDNAFFGYNILDAFFYSLFNLLAVPASIASSPVSNCLMFSEYTHTL
jgi:hypothetical protein